MMNHLKSSTKSNIPQQAKQTAIILIWGPFRNIHQQLNFFKQIHHKLYSQIQKNFHILIQILPKFDSNFKMGTKMQTHDKAVTLENSPEIPKRFSDVTLFRKFLYNTYKKKLRTSLK